VFQKIIKSHSVPCACAKILTDPQADQAAVESAGCEAVVSLFNGTRSDSLASIRYSYLCKKVMTAETFVTPERLPQTYSATIHHAGRTYLQVVVWMGCSENMDPTQVGLYLQGDKLIPIVMDNTPAPDVLLKMIKCNCVGGSSTLRRSCKKFGLECTAGWKL